MKLVKCNKADDPRCPLKEQCEHHAPHEKDGANCTWGDCTDEDGMTIFKVRCEKVKG